jgi:hypothetical protein
MPGLERYRGMVDWNSQSKIASGVGVCPLAPLAESSSADLMKIFLKKLIAYRG